GPEPDGDLLLMAGESGLRLFARHDLAVQRANGHVEITGARARLRVGPLTSASATAVQRLFSSPASESELAADVIEAEGPSALPRPRSLEDLAHVVAGATPDVLGQVLQLLSGAGLIDQGGEEDPSNALGLWEFHDLLFHSRSRLGRRRDPYGGTLRFLGVTDP